MSIRIPPYDRISYKNLRGGIFRPLEPRDRKRMIRALDVLLANATMSPDLRVAVEALKQALIDQNDELAAELSSVKSLISGSMESDPTKYHFTEDDDVNRSTFAGEETVRRVLDFMTHEISWSVEQMAAGTGVFSSGSMSSRPPTPVLANSSSNRARLTPGQAQTLKLMAEEHARIRSDSLRSE